jgi:hypothetical protein
MDVAHAVRVRIPLFALWYTVTMYDHDLEFYMNQWYVAEEATHTYHETKFGPMVDYERRSAVLEPLDVECEDRRRYSWLEPRVFVTMIFEILRSGEILPKVNRERIELHAGDLFIWEPVDEYGARAPFRPGSGLYAVDPFQAGRCPVCETAFAEFPDYLCGDCRYGGMAE